MASTLITGLGLVGTSYAQHALKRGEHIVFYDVAPRQDFLAHKLGGANVTVVQRDVREMARIASLDVLPRLLELAAGQTARLLNVTDLAAPFQLSRPTIRDYVTRLEQVFLIDELQPWHSNRLSRLVKTPKLHIGDTGVGAAILGLDARALHEERGVLGQLLETFVMNSDGSGKTNLTNSDAHDKDPAVSTNGTRILSVRFTDNPTSIQDEIFVMNVDGSGQTNLSNLAGQFGTQVVRDAFPRWSFDGVRIAFVRTMANQSDIWVMNANGSGQTNLSNHAAADHSPRWRP